MEADEELVIQSDQIKQKMPEKCFNCVPCNRIFMSAEAHLAHKRDVHGEDDQLLQDEDKKNEKIEQSDSELVIDDTS